MAKPWHRWPAGLRDSIFARDGHRCQIRGPRCTGTAEDVDHIISPLDGGEWFDPTNLRAACPTCNRGRDTRNRRPTTGTTTGTAPPSQDW